MPGLNWDAALKMTKAEIELLSNPGLLSMFEKGIRGEIVTISYHYAKAIKKNMGTEFDSAKESKIYLLFGYEWIICLGNVKTTCN